MVNNRKLDEIVERNKNFWTITRKECLSKVIKYLGDANRITDKELDLILDDLKGDRKVLPKQEMLRLCKVLVELDLCGVDTAKPAVAQLIPRRSILPGNIHDYAWLSDIDKMINFLWNEWLIKITSNEQWMLSYALILVTENGIGMPVLLEILIKLKRSEIKPDGFIYLTAENQNSYNGKISYLKQSVGAELLLKGILHRKKDTDPEKLIFGTRLGDKKDLKIIRKKLGDAYRGFMEDYQKFSGKTTNLPNLENFVKLGRLLAWWEGMESFILSVQSQLPLPVSHPFDSERSLYFDLLKYRPITEMFYREALLDDKKSSLTVKNQSNLESKAEKEKFQYHNDWCGYSKSLTRRLIRFLGDLTTGPIAGKSLEQALQKIQDLSVEASANVPDTSALHLALDWTAYKIRKGRIKASTVSTYLSRAFLNGLLAHPDSFDLSDWDPEDHETFVEECLTRTRSARTRQHIAVTFNMLYGFAKTWRNGVIVNSENINVQKANEDLLDETFRSEIVGLEEFDTFVSFHAKDMMVNREKYMVAVIALLGFYGGLRAGEVSRLTLADIVYDKKDIDVEIHKGKTKAARRRIPIGKLMPKDKARILIKWIENRKEEFTTSIHLSKIYLFGPKGEPNRFEGRGLIDYVIERLKLYFGNDIVFHSLRHCFASWMILRMYITRYPDLIDKLRDRNHELFAPDRRADLVYVLTLSHQESWPKHSSTGLIQLAKLMGHHGQTTLLHTYVHTFHIIQAHAVDRVSSRFGRRRLSGKIITCIAPMMKSGHTRAKLKEPTVSQLLLYLREHRK